MELTEGKWSNSDLASWFGVSETSFKSHKQEKLEELKSFAEFTLEKGKVYITKVLQPVYSKQSSSNYSLIKDDFVKVWKPGEISTCVAVSGNILDRLELDISPTYAEKITREVRTELYGKPAGKEDGLLGSCMYTWCKRNEETGNLEAFSEEEEEIKNSLLSKYYGTASEKAVIVSGLIETGQIKKEDAWEVYSDMINLNRTSFIGFLRELEKAVGFAVVRGTLLSEKPKSAFLEEK